MADQEIQDFLSRLEVMLSISGVDSVKSSMDEIIKAETVLIKKIKDVEKGFKTTNKTLKDVIKEHKKRAKVSSKGLKETSKNTKEATKNMKNLKKSVGAVSAAFGALKKITGFFVGVSKEALDYRKNIYQLSKSFGYLDIGYTKMENSLLSITKATNLTLSATANLFKQFSTNLNIVSFQQFGDSLARIKDVIGPDVEAIGDMYGAISKLGSIMPQLEVDFAKLASGSMSEEEKKAFLITVQTLAYKGKINALELQRITMLIGSNRKQSEYDKIREASAKKWMDLVAKAKQMWEKIRITIGESVLDSVEQLINKVEHWIGGLPAGINMFEVAFKTALDTIKSKFLELAAIAALLMSGPAGWVVVGAVSVGKFIGEGLRGEGSPSDPQDIYRELGMKGMDTGVLPPELQAKKEHEDQAKIDAVNKKAIQKKIQADRKGGMSLSGLAEKYKVDHFQAVLPYLLEQKDIISDISGAYEGQSSVLSSIIEKQAISGKINSGEILQSLDKALDKNEALTYQYTEQMKIAKVIYKEQLKVVKSSKAYLEADDAGKKNIIENDRILAQAAVTMLDAESQSIKHTERKLSLLSQISNEYKHIISYSEAIAQGQALMVQLADNYAIGVGASAQMRISQFKAEGQVIKNLKSQLAISEVALSKERDNKALQTEVQEIRNKILQKQITQAGLVKTLRDGWISAISAMNTGFGGFSEIIMDSNQGLMQMQRLSGSIRSNLTGAIARRGRGGRVENVGYNRSERLTTQNYGGIAQVSSMRGGREGAWGAAWKGNIFGDMDLRNLETGARGAVMQDIAARNASTVGSGGVMLGAGNAMALSSFQQAQSQPGGASGGGLPVSRAPISAAAPVANVQLAAVNVGVSVNVKDLSDVVDKVTRKVAVLLENEIVDAINAYNNPIRTA